MLIWKKCYVVYFDELDLCMDPVLRDIEEAGVMRKPRLIQKVREKLHKIFLEHWLHSDGSPGTRNQATSGQFQFPGTNWPRMTPGDTPGHFPMPMPGGGGRFKDQSGSIQANSGPNSSPTAVYKIS